MTDAPAITRKERACVHALMNYGQADEDGVMVIVSRQAIHETVEALTAAEEEIAELRGGGVHTCSANCPRPMCALRRERDELREALRWAVAEIDCSTRYDNDKQFDNCMARARAALSKKDNQNG